MDWFRNVRNQSGQSDHLGNQSGRNSAAPDERNYGSGSEDNYNNNNGLPPTRTSKYNERHGSKDYENTSSGGGGSTLSRFMNSSSSSSSTTQGNKKTSVRDDLTCALCGEMYTDPRLLPCLHSFCKRCLEHTVNPRSTILTCHLCRREISLKVSVFTSFIWALL